MKIKTIPVTWLQTNCYIITDPESGKSAVIDPGVYNDRLKQAVEDTGTDSIEYILLTHCHYDHVLGTDDLKSATGAKVVIHEADVAGLDNPKVRMLTGRVPTPDIFVRDGDEIKLGGLSFRVMHTPGHTIGAVCFITQDTIFSGDTLFLGTHGRTDLPTGDHPTIMDSLRKLAGLPGDYDVYPGHGPSTKLNREREWIAIQ
ncbi:MAG: MBL fold metallo-hydrolase [Oscillospiraceae bacterium]|nr:MBL fold metallo-hydrolase [Oscillospiraceae bacterium]